MTALRRNRWAVSFADLCLLLLGFFVLLHASRQGAGAAVSHLSEYFRGQPSEGQTVSLAASALFEPGEAMLTSRGAAKLQEIGKEATENKKIVSLTSVGEDKAGRRFDRWELGAARLAAVARALHQSGLEEGRIVIRGLDESDASTTGQHFIVRTAMERDKAR